MYKENDRVILKNVETGQQKTITVRWLDSRQGFLSKPDYETYHLEENKEWGWKEPYWKIVKRLPNKRKKKKNSKAS